jgi:hypothetical protein
MTESEWLECTDPQKMLEFLRGKLSERKLLLFECACSRRVLNLMYDSVSQTAVERAEAFAEGCLSSPSLFQFGRLNLFVASPSKATRLASQVGSSPESERPYQVLLLRDIFANPFRHVSIEPTWQTPTVNRLAVAAYEERHLPSGELDTARLVILADALEESGCDSADILTHLRGPGPHVRGCWVVDLLLGKE